MTDYYLYNGPIERGSDLRFIELIHKEKASDECVLILVTPGGSPDAAYKMGRYIQHRYETFKIFIPGLCKSAGTLLAIAAGELIFAPYGELGPLDVQMTKEDHLAGLESGLNIGEAFLSLEQRAKETYHSLTMEIIGNSGGIVSYNSASKAATEIIAALYGPIFQRIDPEEVGSRSRAMRIGEDYGARLNAKWSNLKNATRQPALDQLSRSYSSHGFVIDFLEAQLLFERVRMANSEEMAIVETLGRVARLPQQTLTLRKLAPTTPPALPKDKVTNGSHSAKPAGINGTRSPANHPGQAGKGKRPATGKREVSAERRTRAKPASS